MKPRFRLLLQAEQGDSRPPLIRLRAFLKSAWRSWKFRCVECREVKPRKAAPKPAAKPKAKRRAA